MEPDAAGYIPAGKGPVRSHALEDRFGVLNVMILLSILRAAVIASLRNTVGVKIWTVDRIPRTTIAASAMSDNFPRGVVLFIPDTVRLRSKTSKSGLAK